MRRLICFLVFAALLAPPAMATAAGPVEVVADGPETLPVPAVTIYPGDLIATAMLTERLFVPGTSRRFAVAASAEELVDKVARRTLVPGRPVPLNGVAEPDLVVRGQPTQVVYEDRGLQITAVAQALQSAPLGALVQLRNMDSGRVITGTVQADGRVRVDGR